jgi:hypothetical protein
MNKELTGSLAWAGAIFALALGSSFAHKLGYIDGIMVKRIVIGVSGLMFAWYGNRIPKTFAPNASARKAQRVAAWSLVLSGLVYAGLWALAPMPVAIWGGTGAVLAGIAITFAYCLSLQTKAKAG